MTKILGRVPGNREKNGPFHFNNHGGPLFTYEVESQQPGHALGEFGPHYNNGNNIFKSNVGPDNYFE